MYIHHLTDFLLPETPFLVVTILHMLVVCYLVWKGPEVIARMGVIAFAMAFIFYFLVFLASLPEINLNRILPFFDSGVFTVTKASHISDTFVGINQILITMLLPLVSDQKKALRSAAAGISIGGFFFVFYFIVELMVMGSQVVALMRIASMDFVRSIQITQYLHRFESFMVGLWYWSMLVQAGILMYCSIKAFTQTVAIKKIKTKKILVFVFGIIITIISYLVANDRVFFLNYREFTWQYFSLPIQYGVPVILLVFMLLKKVLHSISQE
jgi:spore germination protein KB